MCAPDAWSQDVVLERCANASKSCVNEGLEPDFILVTGDFANSGKTNKYGFVAEFFDAVSAASSDPREQMSCVPGNHDIDRGRQKLAFRGGCSLRGASGLAGTPIRAYNDALFGAGYRSPPGSGRTGVPAGAENRASDRKSRKSHANGISTKGSTPEAVSFLIDSVAFFMKSGCSSAW